MELMSIPYDVLSDAGKDVIDGGKTNVLTLLISCY